MRKYISTVEARNVKALDFLHQLAPVTVIVGDNMAGKTAVLDAIRIGLRKFHPALDKTNAGTFTLAGSNRPEMKVELIIGNDVFKRKWMRKADGSVSLPVDESTFETPDVMLNPDAYFGMKKADRIGQIASMADWTQYGYSDERLLDKIGKIEIPVQAADLLKSYTEKIQTKIEIRQKKGTPIPVWMKDLIDEIGDDLKVAKVAAKTIPSLPLMPTGPKPQNLASAIQGAQDTVKRLKIDLSTLSGDPAASLAALKRAEASLDRQVKERDALIAEDEQLKPIAAEFNKLVAEENRLDDGAKALKQKIGALETIIGNLQAQIGSMDTVEECETCPRCKRGGPEWTALYEKEKADFLKIKDTIEKDLGNTLEMKALIEKELAEAEAAIEANEPKLDKAEEASKRRAVIAGTLPHVKSEVAQAGEELEEAKTAHRAAEAGATARAAKVSELDSAALKLATLQTEQVNYTTYEATRKKRDEIEQTILASDRKLAFLKTLIETFVELQQEIVDACFNEILGKARLFTDGIIGGELGYKDGNFGMTRDGDGQWVEHEVMSGTQKALAYAGFCVALATNAPLKIVIIDELGVVKGERKTTLINRMNELIEAGVIDQFVGADVEASQFYTVTKCKLIEIK